ncbi:TonB-dependent receptor [Polaribacter reichenbachii]|uniref:TonB-dependent receptor n=1 Tax=Polaribacter reichenbachii TaxID=996801 RepID=A0A1B8U0D4_9FLAO|nr:TonB-dependent receptor [Polaribacter reichenbachii]APZ47029.1 TonB-dependent receptor [Polaribacter reichenbachii]AUC17671.1 TonB-dependent receptor [Polaribacter reichenbachii]OBY65307.1 TonB-dependent receptor [Polaribacter reichenbachii]
MRKVISVGIALIAMIINAQEKKKENSSLDSVQKLDQIIVSSKAIFGNKFVAKNRTGSAYYLSAKELQKFSFTDINKALRSVPGVSIYEEDGFGLRPNISLRGTSPERSSKITLMEDGVLIAPAPYSASSAYYFSTIARMEAIEVLKGSSQIQYGPFTTGGAINMVSAQIPTEFNGKVRASYGSYNSNQLHAKIGGGNKTIGYVLEYLNYGSDGFKTLPSGKNTGFNKNDVVAKIKANLFTNAIVKQSLEFKFQYSDEVSNETYLGLTETDFNNNPFARYASSNEDKMTTDHTQYALTYKIDFSKNLRVTTTAYQNNFARNWYKLNDVTFNGDKQSISNVINNPNILTDHFAIINGSINSESDALGIKANNREYTSQGIQTKLDYHWYKGDTFHDLEIGLRYHYDEEDRFQWVDKYSISNTGSLALTTAGVAGTDANRISSAIAFASYVTYKIKFKNWTFTPGIRYENISLEREDFGSDDVNRTGVNLSERENNVAIFIPGIGTNYKFNNDFSIFGGIHKGFSPPGNQDGQEPEESINYELGTRFTIAGINGELVGFFNDYSNLLGSDLAASGGTGSLDQFNAGEVNVNGFELLLNYNFAKKDAKIALPISFGYTYTNTEFKSNFGSSNDLWGSVTVGDEIPYIPKNQFNIGFSVEHSDFEINLNARYSGAFRTLAGSGDIPDNEKVDSNFIVDASAKYFLTNSLSITANIINILDETYAVSKVPAGLRPGHPFGIYGGLEFKF